MSAIENIIEHLSNGLAITRFPKVTWSHMIEFVLTHSDARRPLCASAPTRPRRPRRGDPAPPSQLGSTRCGIPATSFRRGNSAPRQCRPAAATALRLSSVEPRRRPAPPRPHQPGPATRDGGIASPRPRRPAPAIQLSPGGVALRCCGQAPPRPRRISQGLAAAVQDPPARVSRGGG